MCAPVASTSRARVWDRKLRSASTSIPGPNAASRSRAKVCSPTRVGAEAWPRPAPRSPTPPRRASGPAGTPRPGSRSRAGRSTRRSPWCRARRWWSRPSTPPAARSRTWLRRRAGPALDVEGPAAACRGTINRVDACRSRSRASLAVRSSPPTARCPCSSAGCHPRWRADPDPAGVIGIRDEPCSDPSFPRSVRRGLLRDALNHVRQTHQRTSGVPGCRPSVLPRIPGCERHRDRRSRSVFPTAARDVEVCDRAGMARRDHVARPSRPPSIAR